MTEQIENTSQLIDLSVPVVKRFWHIRLRKDETVQVQSATKVHEENEVGKNSQVYEIKHMSFVFQVIMTTYSRTWIRFSYIFIYIIYYYKV